MMRILVVNDDGIEAEGIYRLAKMAKELGEVWVVAPDSQCSAMSHRITLHEDILVRPAEFAVEGVTAYRIGGTPADCVKVALTYLLPEKPDVIFSGINRGYNAGIDVLYSGTVGAAMEGISNGIPSIAFSNEANDVYDVADHYLLSITKELLAQKLPANQMWNVNFPGCTLTELKGVLKGRTLGQTQFYLDYYEKKEHGNGSFSLTPVGISVTKGEEGTDIKALLDCYISVGTITNEALWERNENDSDL